VIDQAKHQPASQISSPWRDKIDPAFDKFIKVYLEFLNISKLPAKEGYLALDGRNLKTLESEGFPSLASIYEHDNKNDALIDFGFMVDETFTEEDFKKTVNDIKREVRKRRQNLFSCMLELSEQMQDESGEYYTRAFRDFISEEIYNRSISDKKEDDIKAIAKKASSDTLSFWFHWIMIPLENRKDEIRKSIQVRNFKYSTRMIKRSMFYTWDAISLMINGESLKELYGKANKGDDAALFKLFQIDKTFFDHKWVRTRINKAAYSGEYVFFESLGQAIRTDPLKHDSRKDRNDRLFLVIRFFWKFGLYRLSDFELHELLISDSICSELETYQDFGSFQKFMQRHRTYFPK
jgi:hypothetical protein